MTGFWRLESSRLLSLAAAILIIGLFTGNWFLAATIPPFIYIAWSLYQLHKLLAWFDSGAKPSNAPGVEGAWGELVHHYNRQRKLQRKRKSRLKSMLNRFNATVSALPDATVILSEQLEIEWANEPARELLKIDASRDLGLPIHNLIRSQEFAALLESGDDKKRLELKSPHDPTVTLLMQLVHFGKGQRLLLARDISDRIEAQRSRKAFVDNASHELKSPLTVIMGYLEAIEMSPRLDESLQVPVTAALGQAQQMNRIIQDLLVLSSLEADNPVPTKIPALAVASVIEDVVEKAKGSGKAKDHQISLALDKTLTVKITESAINSVVTNLIHNALVHTPAGTNVSVEWVNTGADGACFRVVDDGPGVAAEHIGHLTERFYRVDRGRNRGAGSTGLGLAIVKHSAERFGGRLSIQPGEERGMVFEVYFKPESL